MGNQFYNQYEIPCKIGDIICDFVRPDGEENRGDPGIYVVAGISIGDMRVFDGRITEYRNDIDKFEKCLNKDIWIHTYSINGLSFDVFPAQNINRSALIQCDENLRKITYGYFNPGFDDTPDEGDKLVVKSRKDITGELNSILLRQYNHGIPTQKLLETIYEITYEVQYSDGTTKTIKDMITKTVYDEAVRTGLFVESLSGKK